MKTLLFASALLLSAAGADGSPGGSPNEPDPNVNDAARAADMVAEGSPASPTPGVVSDSPAQPMRELPADFAERDEDFQKRLAAERDEFNRIRKLIPAQELELRPCAGAAHLGVIIGTPDGIRCIALADWRTDRLVLLAGDHAQIVVLAGEGLKTWEYYQEQERRSKERPALGAAPARDPLEETQPAIAGTNSLGSETKAANPDTTAAQGS